MAKKKNQVFRVFEEDWEDIMGYEQLLHFCTFQILENFFDENDDELICNIEEIIDEDKQEEIKNLVKDIFNEDTVDLTVEQITELLKLRGYEIEILDVH